MVNFATFPEFAERATALFLASPQRTRYTMKYRHADASLVVKVTDDVTCLKFKTDQVSDLRAVEKLNNLFMRLMSSKKLDADELRREAQQKEASAGQAKQSKSRRQRRDQ